MSIMIDGVSHVDPDELQEIMQNKQRAAVIIDVREPHEYIEAHIPTVPLIPMGEIAEYADDFDKNREYVFICRSGRRSLNVAQYFQELGFDKIHNLYGGMLGWDKEVISGPERIIENFSGMEQLEREA